MSRKENLIIPLAKAMQQIPEPLAKKLKALISTLDDWYEAYEKAENKIKTQGLANNEPAKAFKSAREALYNLPEKDELISYLKDNFVLCIESVSKPMSLYLIDKKLNKAHCIIQELYSDDCDMDFINDLLYEARRHRLKECYEIVKKFHDMVGGIFAKELKQGFTEAKYDKSIVASFIRSDCIDSIPIVDSVAQITLSNSGKIAKEIIDASKFESGRSLAYKQKDIYKNTILRWVSSHYIDYDITSKESPSNTLCRFIGKYIYRHLDCNSPSDIQQREIMFLQGAGRTGVSTFLTALCKRLENVAEAMDSSLEYTDGHSTSKLVGKSLGVVTELNQARGVRVIRSKILRRITCGDPVTINPKNKQPYSTSLYYTVLIGVNSFPKVNMCIADEFTRFYICETRRPKEFIQGILYKYIEDVDEFLGFCYEVYLKDKNSDAGDLLYKPSAMIDIIKKHCVPDEFTMISRLHDLLIRALNLEAYEFVEFAEKDIAKNITLKIFKNDKCVDLAAIEEELELVMSRAAPESGFSWYVNSYGKYITFSRDIVDRYCTRDYTMFVSIIEDELNQLSKKVKKENSLQLPSILI